MDQPSVVPSPAARPTCLLGRIIGPTGQPNGKLRNFRCEVGNLVGEVAEGAAVGFEPTGREVIATNLTGDEPPAGALVMLYEVQGGALIFEYGSRAHGK